MPILEASPGPQGGWHRLQWVSLATQGPKVQGPRLCPERSSAQAPTPAGPASVFTQPLRRCGTGPWAGLTGLSRGGQASMGRPLQGSPGWLLLTAQILHGFSGLFRPLLRASIQLEPLCQSV